MSLLRQPLLRLLAVNLLIGVSVAVLMLGGLLALNPHGLRDLILADRAGGAALALLMFGFLITFGSAAMGTAIMALGRAPERGGGQGGKARPAPARVRRDSGRAEDSSGRSRAGELAGGRHFAMEPFRRNIEAVRPSRRTEFEKNTFEIFDVPQRLDHRARLIHQSGEIVFTDAVVGEAETQAVVSQPINLRNLDHRRALECVRAAL